MERIPLAALILLLATAGCGAGANQQIETSAPPVARNAPSPQPESFTAWRAQFRTKAIAQGISPGVFDAAFQGVGVNATVLRLDGRQAEFTKPIWEYLDSAASPTRVETGRAKARDLGPTLNGIEARYGVDGQAVLAIWGMESNYGANRGDIPVIEALATLAYEGRRRSFGEEQLIAALRILQAGDVSPSAMRGSWAGAMGHTQFIPTSYLSYAVDFTGDGRRDVWGSDPSDGLASAANYLAKSGWQRGRPWGVEVRMPPGFSYAAADQGNRQPVSYWNALGVTADRRPPAARPRLGRDHRTRRRARADLRGLPEFLRHQALQQRHLLRDGGRPSRRPDRRRRPNSRAAGRAASANSAAPRRSSCRNG